MEQLRREIKNKELNGLYFFYGEEKYLLDSYKKSFINACLPEGFVEMNLSQLEGREATAERIAEAAETLPFMSDKKLVFVRNSELFTAKRKTDGERVAEYLSECFDSSDGIVILFVEDSVDKRGKAYKTISKLGKVTEFKPFTESRLNTWIKETLRKSSLSISSGEAGYLIRITGGSMERINKEMEKLAAYKSDGIIARTDIDDICTKTAESRVFDLIDAIAAKNRGAALSIYSELLEMKEQPLGILAMISRQFRLMLKCRLFAEEGHNLNVITEKLGANPYSVKISSAQAKGFRLRALKQAVLDCAECDMRVKTGIEEARLGVEMIIIRYSEKNQKLN